MLSSTSSSETGFDRTAVRGPWGRRWFVVAALTAAAVAGWEWHWRGEGYGADLANSAGFWNLERRRVEPTSTVIVGSSRVFFDVDVATWSEVIGAPVPIMLALEGTPPWTALADLAGDPDFRGFLVVGYTPGLFFGGFPGERGGVPAEWRKESPSERVAQRLSMGLERRFAWLDDDAKLRSLLTALPWPARSGIAPSLPKVPRLGELSARREQVMWWKVESDPAYRQHARDVWTAFLSLPRPPAAEERIAMRIAETKAAVEALRARGGEVLFVRCPSVGPFREAEREAYPREQYWDRLLRETDAVGVHFEDHAGLQGFELPEWSHLRAGDRIPFTRALAVVAEPTYAAWVRGK